MWIQYGIYSRDHTAIMCTRNTLSFEYRFNINTSYLDSRKCFVLMIPYRTNKCHTTNICRTEFGQSFFSCKICTIKNSFRNVKKFSLGYFFFFFVTSMYNSIGYLFLFCMGKIFCHICFRHYLSNKVIVFHFIRKNIKLKTKALQV